MNHSKLITGVVAAGAFCCGARLVNRVSRRMDLRHRVALITGGSRGLGLILARQLGARGVRVAICARDEAELDRARQDLRYRGIDVLPVQCDLTIPSQVTGLIDGVRNHYGPIDILINNAGTIQVGPREEMTLDDYDQAMKLHFYAPLVAAEACIPEMVRRRSGRIVNISSIGGKVPIPHLLPYVASKFALSGWSQGLRTELQQYNVYVTTVHPGLMRTGSPYQARFKGQNEKEFAWFIAGDSTPLTSMNADRAARKIVHAMKYALPEVTLSVQAKALATMHALMPGVMSEIHAMVNQMLPRPGGIGKSSASGAESDPNLVPESVTKLTDQAAEKNNEVLVPGG